MPIDIGRKQTIEEITNGRITKKAMETEKTVRSAGRGGAKGGEMAARGSKDLRGKR